MRSAADALARTRRRTGLAARAADAGQATIEAVLVVPVLLALGAGLAQGLVAAWSAASTADAARAGARGALLGGDGLATARAALPASLRAGARVATTASGLRVEVRVPTALPGSRLRVAEVEP